ncbi:MAG TPA: DMT family transporter [Lapillicoccus sp.]|nr:DMT family transporter [Lapillicoccus sp.]
MLFWAVGTLLAGGLLSVQARMNGELSHVWGRGLDAAIWSFGSGLLILTLLAVVVKPVRTGAARLRKGLRDGEIQLWQCFGGVIGGLYVFAQAYAVPLIGVALFTIATVGGQTASAVVVDRFGIGPTGRLPVSWLRVLGAVLSTVGVIIAVGGRVSVSSSQVILPAVLALVGAAFVSVQQGTNGRVTVVTRQAMTTTWLNFGTGTVTLLLCAIPGRIMGAFGEPASTAVPWWAWLGGLCGIIVVSVTALAVRHLGVLLIILLMLAGQLATAILLDALNPETRGQISPVVLLGLLVTVAAAALAGLGAARAQRAGRPTEEATDRVAG